MRDQACQGLDLLLRLTAVMGGSFTLASITPVWATLTSDGKRDIHATLNECIQHSTKLRLLKWLSSGAVGGSDRRRSSTSGAGGRVVAFHHLKIFDSVRD